MLLFIKKIEVNFFLSHPINQHVDDAAIFIQQSFSCWYHHIVCESVSLTKRFYNFKCNPVADKRTVDFSCNPTQRF